MFFGEKVQSGSEIRIPAGVHYQTEPVVVRGKNIRIRGEEGTVLRGTAPLRREDFWEESPGVWCADVAYRADSFYIADRKYTMARYPKGGDPEAVFGGYGADCIFPEKTRQWANPAGGYIHAMHAHLWGGYSYRIEGKQDDHTLILSGGWQNNRQMGMHGEYRFAENIWEEMTEPGEWYFDEKARRVYVRLYPGDDLDQAEIGVSRGFFLLENCENVTVENIVFERSARTFMETKEPLLRSDWTICRNGGILIRRSAHCSIDRCAFRDVGSNGVFVDGQNRDITVSRCYFSHIGASGLCFVGHADAVRSPLFSYNETQSVNVLDLEPGPRSDNYPQNCTVEECLIEYVGETEKQATGVEISIAYGITVKNCTVCHTSRSGINISEGTFGGHRIEGCDVFDTVRETGDHGCFNSWGRDRFWHLQDLEEREAGKYALLDMLGPNVITRSRFRCDRGWDIDLDDGSTNYVITENLCLNGGIKLREGFFRKVRNNIMVNNTLHFHVWYPDSGDIVENNIVFDRYVPIGMPSIWGTRVDGNILAVADQDLPVPAEELAAQSGQDAHSVRLDPGFTAPEESNYMTTHPLIRGFEKFPTVFGVRYKPLRDIADMPVLPKATLGEAHPTGSAAVMFAMTVKNIETDGEMSVYGTAGHSGVLVLAVEQSSPAEKRGIAAGDVIVGWDDEAVGLVEDLAGRSLTDQTRVTVIRKQRRTAL